MRVGGVIMNEWSLHLRDLRLAARLTQDDLARRAGLSRKTVSTLERGQASQVSVGALLRVLEVLGARLDVRDAPSPTLDDLLKENEQLFHQPEDPAVAPAGRVRRRRNENQGASPEDPPEEESCAP